MFTTNATDVIKSWFNVKKRHKNESKTTRLTNRCV